MPYTSAIKSEASRGRVAFWLAVCALLVALMVVIGGYTRLSGSGLSITQWKPIHGIIPPLSDADWLAEFNAYKATPQYAKINAGMSMEEFRTIFWPEYTHRALGRIIGFVFFLPLLYFALRRRITWPFVLRLLFIFSLGGLQGFAGWYMVQSGLINDPFVDHLRLAFHLGLAFLIFALLLSAWFDVAKPRPETTEKPPGRLFLPFLTLLLFIQIIFGAMLAGLHGGLIYNTFPLMNGEWLPSAAWYMQPLWKNPIENIAAVQFIHRWLAKILIALYALWWWKKGRHTTDLSARKLAHAVLVAFLLQATLGVLTLLNVVPLPLALAHQLTGLLLFALVVLATKRARKALVTVV